ncbi:uncharacterized protein LOC131929647 [Physella acuta]|uniref:uncharacterized protein LOC131929647 n=1 Tax=Physella acuta TaxID=109671 RepID=UPI0027DDFE11|nr:uncharacterized protein LOC131929647 [Physella acuta]
MVVTLVVLVIYVTSLVSGCEPPRCKGDVYTDKYCDNVSRLETADPNKYGYLFPLDDHDGICNTTFPITNQSSCCPKERSYECTSVTSNCLPLFWYKELICKAVCPNNLTYTECTCDNCIPDCPLNDWCKYRTGTCEPSCGRLWDLEAYCLYPPNTDPLQNPVNSFIINISLCLGTECLCIPRLY